MRSFTLVRTVDVTGKSGTGTVAEGVEWTSGKVTVVWLTQWPSVATFDSLADLLGAHGHEGSTTAVFEERSGLHRVADRVADGLAFNRIEASRDYPVQVEVNGRGLWLEWLRAFSSADHPEDAATREGLRPEEYYLWRYRWVDPTGAVLVTYLTAGDE